MKNIENNTQAQLKQPSASQKLLKCQTLSMGTSKDDIANQSDKSVLICDISDIEEDLKLIPDDITDDVEKN